MHEFEPHSHADVSFYKLQKKSSPKNQSQRKSQKNRIKILKPSGKQSEEKSLFLLKPGDNSAVVPPGPVPNPEVKRCSADGSRTIGPARVGRRRDFNRASW